MSNLIIIPRLGGGSGGAAESIQTKVFNQSGSMIPRGSVVYVNGAHGNLPTIALSKADAEITSSKTFGLVLSNIADNKSGYVVVGGKIQNLNTDIGGWTEGDQLWLSPSVAGGIVNVRPTPPNHAVYIGTLIRKHPTKGAIELNIQNGYELQELHNVLFGTSPIDGDFLGFNAATGLWVNKNLTNTGKDQITLEFNGLGGVVQAPSFSGVSNIKSSGTITGWTLFSQNPSTGLALSGSIDIDVWVGAAGSVPTVSNTIFSGGNNPKLTSQSYAANTSLLVNVTAGQTIMAKVNSATSCVLVNLQLILTRS